MCWCRLCLSYPRLSSGCKCSFSGSDGVKLLTVGHGCALLHPALPRGWLRSVLGEQFPPLLAPHSPPGRFGMISVFSESSNECRAGAGQRMVTQKGSLGWGGPSARPQTKHFSGSNKFCCILDSVKGIQFREHHARQRRRRRRAKHYG